MARFWNEEAAKQVGDITGIANTQVVKLGVKV